MMGVVDLSHHVKDMRCRKTSHLNASLGHKTPKTAPQTSSDRETSPLAHLDRGFTAHRPQRQVRTEGLGTGKDRQNCYTERNQGCDWCEFKGKISAQPGREQSKDQACSSWAGPRQLPPAPCSQHLLPPGSQGQNCTRAANFLPPAQEQPLASAPRHLLVCYYRHKPSPSPAGARNVLRNPSSKGPCSCLGNRHRHPGRWSHGTSSPAAWFPLVGSCTFSPMPESQNPRPKT